MIYAPGGSVCEVQQKLKLFNEYKQMTLRESFENQILSYACRK